jgi:hypothetical protein
MTTMSKRERQYKHVLERALSDGLPLAEAQALAARVVNKERAARAKGKLVCRPTRKGVYCHVEQGPQLVGQGGSRRQWYPGKKRTDELFVCLQHDLTFKQRADLLTHYRSHRRAAENQRAKPKRAKGGLRIFGVPLWAAWLIPGLPPPGPFG